MSARDVIAEPERAGEPDQRRRRRPARGVGAGVARRPAMAGSRSWPAWACAPRRMRPATTGSRCPASRPRTVIIGGHLDSVPNGGWLDGPLGVLAGIEALRRRQGHAAAGHAGRRGLRGRRRRALLAQPAGILGRERHAGAGQRQSTSWTSRACGWSTRSGRTASTWTACPTRIRRCWRATRAPISSCTSSRGRCSSRWTSRRASCIGTYGVERHVLRFTGQTAHSGSTPMSMRRDAFLAAAETALACRDIARRLATPDAGPSGGSSAPSAP